MATRQEIESEIRNVDSRIQVNRKMYYEAQEYGVRSEMEELDSAYRSFMAERAQWVRQLEQL